MAEIAVALGATYIILAIAHGKALNQCRRRIWCVVHSALLTGMGLLYMAYGVAFVPH